MIRITLADGKIIEFEERDKHYIPVSDGVYDNLTKTEFGFHLKFKDGTAYNFNNDGKIKSITDNNGNALNLEYEDGNLAAVSSMAENLKYSMKRKKSKALRIIQEEE